MTVNREADKVENIVPIVTYQRDAWSQSNHKEDCDLYAKVMEKMKNLREVL